MCLLFRLVTRAHPRRCGENAAELAATAMTQGSSPQVRGKHSFLDGEAVGAGLIPAGAGKTLIIRRG